jgi:hypothetical protein
MRLKENWREFSPRTPMVITILRTFYLLMKQAKNIRNNYIIVLTAKKMYNMFMQKMTLLKMIKYNHIGMSSFLK